MDVTDVLIAVAFAACLFFLFRHRRVDAVRQQSPEERIAASIVATNVPPARVTLSDRPRRRT